MANPVTWDVVNVMIGGGAYGYRPGKLLTMRMAARLVAFVLSCVIFPALAAEGSRQSLPNVQELRRFAEAYSAVKDSYVEPLAGRELMAASLKGLVSNLDPDSEYLDADRMRELSNSADLAGIGLELRLSNQSLEIVSAFEGTPAAAAGLMKGDLITRIDDRSPAGMTLAEGVGLLRGRPSSQVVLTIQRLGQQLPIQFVLKRKVIAIQTLKFAFLDQDYAYIRLSQFQDSTGPALAKKLQTIFGQQPIMGLVLDLRNNAGGLFQTGIGVAATFLSPGVAVVTTDGQSSDAKRRYLAVPADYLRGREDDYLAGLPVEARTVPMVVIVNKGTAAGAEIVAGALQANKRAIILGTRTFGRNSIQTILPLPKGGALKLTTSRWQLPNASSLHFTGIVPDIVIAEKQIESYEFGTADDQETAKALSVLKKLKQKQTDFMR